MGLVLLGVCVVAASVACAGGERDGGPGPLPTLIAEPALRIGSVEDDENALTWFRGLEIGPAGRIFTIHPEESLIRIHDPDGEFLGTLGGVGEGPGEFSSPRSLGFRGDTIWVLDGGTYRFSHFGLDGAFLRDERVRIDLGTGGTADPPRPSGLLPDGTMWGSSPAWSHLVASGEITETAYLRLDTRGAVLDTLAVYSLVNSELAVMRDDGRGGFFTRQPYSDAEIVRLSAYRPEVLRVDRALPEGDAEPAFRVTKLSFGGDTLWSRRFGYEPTPLGAAAVDSFVADFAATVAERGFMTRGQAEQKLREALYRPRTLPPVAEAVPGRDGSVWLQMARPAGEASTWWALSTDGNPLGEVELPARFRLMNAVEGRVWGMETDELDVPYIVAYAIRRAEPLEDVGATASG